ncbi:carbohydrate ABC transporter substrate-binding protein (CUT1 family) [Hydrogenispora ethanolica]|uniref:Carbohydrate ABC transporter substrate-binding protein (CUT1 family) n=1 Tax=Hydrogenispora ethanolica TaxID=1082276 RepID=A0A4R1S8P1_HYDET|nr:sugar ABC transporter substrate-binding protein [Hydrogenispora ethanolica]TCL75280.1 carbohydrate ABC transporter substrate-binding protein (CUT1 family) [Hydrogenispora ethanolica]
MLRTKQNRWRTGLGLAMLLAVALLVNLPVSQAENVTLRFVAANHPFYDVIKPLLPEFEKQTGIKVRAENYEENQLTPKLTVEFTSNASTIDVFMTRPLQEGKLFSRNKWYEPLNRYINDRKKTPARWGWSDFPKSAVQAVTHQGSIGAVPIVTEWQVVFYRKDLFQQAKLKAPKTLEELEAAAAKLNNPAGEFYGIVSRGQRGAAVTQFSSYLYNFGGDFIKDGKCVIDSPEAVKAFKYYGKLLKNYGPPGVTNMSWPQAQALFASGKVAMWTDASVLIAGLLDEKSKVADKIGVALFPAGPAGNHPFMIVPWSLAIPAQSRNKEAAWKFVQWAASKEIAKKAQLAGLTMARNSVWTDKEVLAKIQPDLALTAKQTGPIATPYDRPLMTAVVEARDIIGDVIVKAIETGGNADIESLAKAAAKGVDALLDKAGEGK